MTNIFGDMTDDDVYDRSEYDLAAVSRIFTELEKHNSRDHALALLIARLKREGSL